MSRPCLKQTHAASAPSVARKTTTRLPVALAWLLHQSPHILLIPGASLLAHPREKLAAGRLALSPESRTELDGATAYAAHHASGNCARCAARSTASARVWAIQVQWSNGTPITSRTA